MSWNYRVVEKDGWFGIHEVYYDPEGNPDAVTENPIALGSETADGIREELDYYAKALARPILKYEDFVSKVRR